jgi:hypothetical protein
MSETGASAGADADAVQAITSDESPETEHGCLSLSLGAKATADSLCLLSIFIIGVFHLATAV